MELLDTTFLIDFVRGREESRDMIMELENKGEVITIAVPSIVELFKGIYLKDNIKNIKSDEVEKIKNAISSYENYNLDKDGAILAGEIEADLLNRGERIDIEDILIGAIAKQNGEKLITRNIKHFDRIKGLEVEGY